MFESGTGELSEVFEARKKEIWLAAVFVPIIVVGVGSVVRPDVFYDRFFWQYLFGPVVADSQTTAVTRNGITATPGYTPVSSAVYAYYLLLAVVGSVWMLDYFDAGDTMSFFYALVPYGFVGGAVRVVEDTGALDAPLAYFFISPVIYITMFIMTVLVFVAALYAERRGTVDDYATVVAGAGGIALAGVLGYLAYFGVTGDGFIGWVPVVVLGAATVVTVAVWLPVDRLAPSVNAGTGLAGVVLLWGHLLDAFSTVVGLDYLDYGEKQPIVETIIESTGTSYSFVVVKIGIVLLILYAFDEEFFEEFRRLPYILLVAVLAVGLGPGTRNTLRMTLGI